MRRLPIVLGVALLAAIGVVFATSQITDRPHTYLTPIDAYGCTNDPRKLNIFTGVGPGDSVIGTDVREDPEKVGITVRAVDPEYGKGFQNLSMTFVTVSVVLKDPLASRLVVDQTGAAIRSQCSK